MAENTITNRTRKYRLPTNIFLANLDAESVKFAPIISTNPFFDLYAAVEFLVENVGDSLSTSLSEISRFAREQTVDCCRKYCDPMCKMFGQERRVGVEHLMKRKRIIKIDGVAEQDLFPKIGDHRQMVFEIQPAKMVADFAVGHRDAIKICQQTLDVGASFDVPFHLFCRDRVLAVEGGIERVPAKRSTFDECGKF